MIANIDSQSLLDALVSTNTKL